MFGFDEPLLAQSGHSNRRLHHLDRTNEARPEPGDPDEQRAIAAAQSTTRRCAAKQWQVDGGVTNSQLQARPRDLNRSTNIPSTCKIANIALNVAMILSYDANPAGWNFRKGQRH